MVQLFTLGDFPRFFFTSLKFWIAALGCSFSRIFPILEIREFSGTAFHSREFPGINLSLRALGSGDARGAHAPSVFGEISMFTFDNLKIYEK